MSEPLMITLIAVTVNLGGLLVIYSFLAFFLVRLHWHGRGILAVLMTIIIANVFWGTIIGWGTNSWTFTTVDWLVSAFFIVIFSHTAERIPRQLEDSARLDGCGWFGTYWHIVLPLVRRDLGFLALFLVMPTIPFLLPNLSSRIAIDCYPSLRKSLCDLSNMLVQSAIWSLVPLVVIFFVVRGSLRHPADAEQTGSASTR